MAATLPRRSRLRFSELLVIDGFEFWDLVDYPEVPEQRDDLQYTTIQTDRLDLLAQRYYGDPIFWWVIAVANDLDLPQADLRPNLVLRIPSPRYVREVLFTKVKV